MDKYLNLLSKNYKNIQEVSEEIINLQAILNLPKGSELFFSDIHGEYEAFVHLLNNGSGIIKNKIDDLFGNLINENERKELATLIYYPEEKLELVKKSNKNMNDWYRITLYRLIEVTRAVSSKYTRSKVRKAMPKGFDYIIDELLHSQGEDNNKKEYYRQIIYSIIDLDRADAFIVAITKLIKRMAIDHLHIVGDIFDRGPGASIIMDELMEFHSLDIQWGNHDILWMGAALGNEACIANVVRICSKYDNLQTLEDEYGINIRPLSLFATSVYANDECKMFMPVVNSRTDYSKSDKDILAKIQKAIAVIQFKIEGQLIKKHPEYEMENMLLLDKIDFRKGTINIGNEKYELKDKYFPTIMADDPYKLTEEEEKIVERLKYSFCNSEKLNKHVNFLYAVGNSYKIFNENVLFHSCVPTNEDGNFIEVDILGQKKSGKELFEVSEEIIRKAYYGKNNEDELDLMWYFWCGPKSVFVGKDKLTTFERYFIDDKNLIKENNDAYYNYRDSVEFCDKILENFGVDVNEGHIINGHVPVIAKDGESPIKANGKMIVIDGGFAKAYQETTGTAGYTLTYNSNGLLLSVNKPFTSKKEAIEEGSDIKSQIILKEHVNNRKSVSDTDIGKKLQGEIDDLKKLLNAYRDDLMEEK